MGVSLLIVDASVVPMTRLRLQIHGDLPVWNVPIDPPEVDAATAHNHS